MTGYVAFLRGVNLGPTRKVAMPRLREIAEELGYADVWTYLNSGNLALSCDKPAAKVERELADALRAEYGVGVDVAVRTVARLGEVVQANPFPDGSPSQVTVAFLTGAPARDAEQRVAEVATAAEQVSFAGREVWVLYGDGQARSKLAADFSRVVGVSSTVRTLGTCTKILAKAEAT